MIKLVDLLRETIITEGGNVFKNTEYDAQDIALANIEPTVKKFVEDFGKLFPNKKSTFTGIMYIDDSASFIVKRVSSFAIFFIELCMCWVRPSANIRTADLVALGWSVSIENAVKCTLN